MSFYYKRFLNIISLIFFLFFIQSSIQAKDIEFPLIQSFSYFPYFENSLIAEGTIETGIDIYHSNIFTFNKEDNIMNDFELTSFTLGLRYGLTNRITAELFVRYAGLSGGIMDGFIEKFHKILGLPDAFRPDYPRDIVNYFNNDNFEYEKKTGSISPIIASLLVRVFSEENFNINTRIGLGIPVKSKPGLSSDKFFLTAGVICSYKRDNLKVEFSNYISLFKEPEWLLSEDLKDKMFFSEIRIVYKRFLTGFIFRTSPFIESEASRNAYQIQLGFKISDKIEFLFLEDFAPFDTTPDISCNLRIRF